MSQPSLIDSLTRILFGLLLFCLSFPVLVTNEGRAVRAARSLDDGPKAVGGVPIDRVDAKNEGKLVHGVGEASTKETLTDTDFAVSATRALMLTRSVQMYQWIEDKHETSATDAEETEDAEGAETPETPETPETATMTYTYRKDWDNALNRSGAFKEPQGHENPASMPFADKRLVAKNATVGAFALPPALVEAIDQAEPLRLGASAVKGLPVGWRSRGRVQNDTFYLGANALRPAVGDMRITFQVTKPTTVTFVAAQQKRTLVPYQTRSGDTLAMLKVGRFTHAAMLKRPQPDTEMLTWSLRGAGLLMMFVGMFMVFGPLAAMAEPLPWVGNMLRLGLALFCGTVSAGLWLLTVAVAWVAQRPLMALPLLVVAAGILAGMHLLAKRKAAERAHVTQVAAPRQARA